MTVLLGYLAWTAWYAHHHPVSTLAHVSAFFQGRHGSSASIARLTPTAGKTVGYDGQFYLFIATDPVGARPYLDNAPYRYGRPLFPLAARALAFGRPAALPWTLVFLGICGVVFATFGIAVLAKRSGISPWYGALAGVYPGLFLAVFNVLAEALAYGLLVLGLLAWQAPRSRLVLASLLFGLAGLTRETTLIFPIVIALWLVFRDRRVRDGITMLALAVAPYLIVKSALAVWLGAWGLARASHLEYVPFRGFLDQWPGNDYTIQQLLAVVAPALLAPLVVWRATRAISLELAMLVANVLVLIVLLPTPSYVNYLASGRIATGVVIAFLLCLPVVIRSGHVASAWVPITLWLLPWYTVFPQALRR